MSRAAETPFARLLAALGYRLDDRISINVKDAKDRWGTVVYPVSRAADAVARMRNLTDVWFGVCPIDLLPGRSSTRGNEDHVVAWPALWCDLDKHADETQVHAVVAELARLLGVAGPTALVHSGGGFHAYWRLDRDEATELASIAARTRAAVLLERWGALVKRVATEHGGKADSVFDLPRVLRVPGTVNTKREPGRPVRLLSVDSEVSTSVARLVEVLDREGIPEAPATAEDNQGTEGTEGTLPGEWTWAERDCRYFAKVVSGWATDQPAQRHPWLVGQAVRIASAHRYGCLTESAHRAAVEALADRFGQLLDRASDPRAPGRSEVDDALAEGIRRAGRKSREELAKELGGHEHVELPPLDEGTTVLPSPDNPMAVVRAIEPEFRAQGAEGSGRAPFTTRHWRGGWWRWQGSHWAEIEAREMSRRLYERTEHAVYLKETKRESWYEPWSPTKVKLANLGDALGSVLLLEQGVDAPAWLDDAEDPGPVVACANGLLRLSDRALLPHDPRYFNLVAVPFDYEPDAGEPAEWLKFLATVWPDGGGGQVDALQEWFGYVVSGRLDFQKMLAIVGPPRSGKGTIARVLVELTGKENTAGPTLAGLATNFGLSALLGKSLAVISDARLGNQSNRDLVVERLLTISGEDAITVDRKHREHWYGKLAARVMLMSNELPRFADSSGVIASRFIVLEHTRSFLGNEDRGLDRRLAAELPGILNWALAGLDRLLDRGRFTEPAVSVELGDMMRQTASPYAAFVADDCVVDDRCEVEADSVWKAWTFWCAENGRERTGTKQWLGRDLKSVVPGVRVVKRQRPDKTRYNVYVGIGLRSDYPELVSPADEGARPRMSSDATIAHVRGNEGSTDARHIDVSNKNCNGRVRGHARTRAESAPDPMAAPPRPAVPPAPCPQTGDPDHEPDFCGACLQAARNRSDRR